MESAQILVVEDEGIVAKDIQNMLQRLGYGVSGVVSSGEKAIEKAGETEPDLVLMDIILKGDMDGVKAAEEIRSRFNIPVVYLTACADNKTLLRAGESEPFGYLLKPFEEKALHATVEMALYRHKMEGKLRESEQWFSTTLKSIGDAVLATDRKGSITFMNPVAESVTRWTQEEAFGKALMEVFNISNENSDSPAENPVEKVLQEGRVVELANGIILKAKDGTKIPINDSAAPIKDERGNITGVVLVFQDISRRKELETQFLHAQKMEVIGRFAGGMAHDFNNILTTIMGHTELLLFEHKPGTDDYESLKTILESAKRAAQLTRQLLAISRKQVLEQTSLNINHIIDEMSKIFPRVVGEDMGYDYILEPGLDNILADSGQIEQIILNLVVNARDAMPKGGKLTFTTKNIYLDKEYCRTYPVMTPGKYVLLSLSDTGEGISPEIIDHIFEPFYTTKAKRSGLGLSTVFDIVNQMGGQILVSSEETRGASFKVHLPARSKENKEAESLDLSRKEVMPHGKETILLVEDEPAILVLTERLLSKLGYTVLTAESGEEALARAHEYDGVINLLFTDVVLPGKGGPEVAGELQKQNRQLKILFMSGYTADRFAHTEFIQGKVNFLSKPFSPITMTQKIREILDR